MKQDISQWARAAVGLLFLSSTSGCSFIFVRGPSSDGRITSQVSSGSCTSSRLAPALDTTFGALQLVRTGLAATASDRVYADPDAPLSREADVALGASFAALFVGSAIYGFVNTHHCSRLHTGEDRERAPADPPETWGPSPRGAQPAAAAPLPSVAPAVAPAPTPATPPAPAATAPSAGTPPLLTPDTETPPLPESLPGDTERPK